MPQSFRRCILPGGHYDYSDGLVMLSVQWYMGSYQGIIELCQAGAAQSYVLVMKHFPLPYIGMQPLQAFEYGPGYRQAMEQSDC